MLLEHPPVYSRGRRTKAEELPMGDEWYEARGIEVLDTDRGGLVTYHGPGQLVAYPIVDLAPLGGDVHEYVRGLERVMIGSLAEHGVGAQTIEGLTGVWTEGPPPGPGRRGRGEEDRLDRHPRQQGDHHARAGGQRRQRPAAVRVGRAVRDPGRGDDLDRAEGGSEATVRRLWGDGGAAFRRRVRA